MALAKMFVGMMVPVSLFLCIFECTLGQLQPLRWAMALGLGGLFLEAHPNPNEALCDGPSALPLDKLEPFLAQMKAVDTVIKNLPPLDIV